MRFRLHAASAHALIGLLVFATMIWPIICLWYPQGLLTQLQASQILLLIIGVDLALGPLLTASVFSANKSHWHRWFDESIVIVLQVAALTYGLYTLYSARPAYVVWHSNAFYVVRDKDIQEADLNLVEKELRPTLVGPQWVTSVWPRDPEQRQEGSLLSMTAIEQRHYFPQYFHPLKTAYPEIKSSIQTIPKNGVVAFRAEVDEKPFKAWVLGETGQPVKFVDE